MGNLNEDERTRITNQTNLVIENDLDVPDHYPISTNTMQIFDQCKDGLILCKLINDSVLDTIGTRIVKKPTACKPLNAFQTTKNHIIGIAPGKGTDTSVVNISSNDMAEGRDHLILAVY